MRDEMVFAVRHGLFDIVKIQTLAVLVMVVFAPTILTSWASARCTCHCFMWMRWPPACEAAAPLAVDERALLP